MSWVNSEEASHWIQQHALKTPLSRVVQLGGYDSGKSERERERVTERVTERERERERKSDRERE